MSTSSQTKYITFLRSFQQRVPEKYPEDEIVCQRCGPRPCKYHPPEFKYHPDSIHHLNELEDGMRSIDRQLRGEGIEPTTLPYFKDMVNIFNNVDRTQGHRTPWKIANNVANFLESSIN